jgi:UPF0271 protein
MPIDLNCDMGEGFGAWTIGDDAELLRHVSSANIACGLHAGDPMVMRRTVRLAREHGAAVGAHPGLPDLQGFGRRAMAITPDEAYALMLYQIGALAAIAGAEGVVLTHVKPHGALYNMAAVDRALADALAAAARDADAGHVLVGLSGSALVAAGRGIGLRVASEVFADRTYQPDGTLTPRTRPDALHHHTRAAVEQVLRMVHDGVVVATDGSRVPVEADTVCIHGDGAHAADFARALRSALRDAGIEVTPLARLPR